MFGGSEVRLAVINVMLGGMMKNIADEMENWEQVYYREPEKVSYRGEQTGWELHIAYPYREMIGGHEPDACKEIVADMWREMQCSYVEAHMPEAGFKALREQLGYKELRDQCAAIYDRDTGGIGPEPETDQMVPPGFMVVPGAETMAAKEGRLVLDEEKAREWGYSYFDEDHDCAYYKVDVEFEPVGEELRGAYYRHAEPDEDQVRITAGFTTCTNATGYGYGALNFVVPLSKLRPTRVRAMERLIMRKFRAI